ncbi:hypothetical protein Tsubulata_048814 [Turnera subulata]|uniref:Uncharacterized protein n=1 Tax=Turnera subulata TaxID=218843 RepID=A0A9Q0JF21_9ROSI|nr:hypothetical protein Tsubulata_048814 [Turnera subulata]
MAAIPRSSSASSSTCSGSPSLYPISQLRTRKFYYLIFLFAFSLLSTSVIFFTVTSVYSNKPVSSSSTMAAIPKVFKRLFVTFLWVSLLMLVYNSVFLVILIIVVDTQSTLLVFLCLVHIFVHVYITAFSHLASVVSVLELIYGFAAMKKRSSSRERPASWRCSSSGTSQFAASSRWPSGRWWSTVGISEFDESLFFIWDCESDESLFLLCWTRIFNLGL